MVNNTYIQNSFCILKTDLYINKAARSIRYKILESRPWLLGTSPQAVIGKVLIDQAVSAPIVLFLFFTGK